MTDLATILAALRRPKILIRAARAGVVDYRRERDLKRLLRRPRRRPGAGHRQPARRGEAARGDPHRRRGDLQHPAPRRRADRDPRRGPPAAAAAAAARLTRNPTARRDVRALPFPPAWGSLAAVTGRLIIASNRIASARRPARRRPRGRPRRRARRARGGVWFGWSGETVERETRGVRLFAEGNVDYALADLTQAEYDGYYLGYANRALWPVFHYRVDLAHFDEADFAAYEAVNRRFGRLLAQFTRPDDIVWVHDYHFLLMGQELRASGWDGRMGFFLHIPFPAPEVFTALPQHQRLARGLCAFDLVGFQTERDTANFRRYLVEHRGAHAARRRHASRSSTGPSAPRPSRSASIPTTSRALAESGGGRAAADRLGRIIENRALVIGVDRMDYSKGLPQRMEAFGRDARRPRGAARPGQLPADRAALARGRRRLPGAARGARPPRRPDQRRLCRPRLDADPLPRAQLLARRRSAGLYRLSRVGLVTPLHDGMNLVAKEFVAAQDPEDPGALVLSEFAGAAEQLQAALLVNPHDIGATADAIFRALSMPLEERRERWQEMIRRGPRAGHRLVAPQPSSRRSTPPRSPA